MTDPASMAQQNIDRIRLLDRQKAAAATSTAMAATSTGSTAATAQAAAGAAQTQPGAAQSQQAEAFSAPLLDLGPNPTLGGTIRALGVAMAHPSVNESSAQLLKQFHDQLFEMYKANIEQWTIRRVS